MSAFLACLCGFLILHLYLLNFTTKYRNIRYSGIAFEQVPITHTGCSGLCVSLVLLLRSSGAGIALPSLFRRHTDGFRVSGFSRYSLFIVGKYSPAGQKKSPLQGQRACCLDLLEVSQVIQLVIAIQDSPAFFGVIVWTIAPIIAHYLCHIAY